MDEMKLIKKQRALFTSKFELESAKLLVNVFVIGLRSNYLLAAHVSSGKEQITIQEKII